MITGAAGHPGDGIAEAVTALPALPAATTDDRYGVPALTVTWLAGFAPHTRTAYFRDLAHFLAWCQRHLLDPMRARGSDLDRYRAALEAPTHGGSRGRSPSPATVHRRLSALSSWYRYLLHNGATTTNPAAGIRRPRVDRDASATVGLTAEQVRALLRRADEQVETRRQATSPAGQARLLAALRDRALLRLLADLGLRIGEALALDVDALSHNQGRRTIRYLGKGGKRRERPLTGQVITALDEYLARRAAAGGKPDVSGPLFATTGLRGVTGRLGEPAAFRLVRRLAGEAAIPSAERLSPHSLRHAFATNAREIGVPLEDVQDAMGHADARTTRRYDRGRHALHRDPALKLGDLYAGHAPDTGW
jgi:integrase/recombinase XerD